MRAQDRIHGGPIRGDAATAAKYAADHGAAKLDSVRSYLAAVYRIAPMVAIDPAIVVAQSAHETNGWTSFWWVERLNPAGLGVTGDPEQNSASPTFPSGPAAARAHIAHLLTYALGPSRAAAVWLEVVGERIEAHDPRYTAYISAYGDTARATVIADLAYTWARDRDYAAGVCKWGNAIFPGLPDQAEVETVGNKVVFGKVPEPKWQNQFIEKPEGHGYGYYGPRRFRGIVLHRMAGTLLGTRSHFRAKSGHGLDALTDWGIGGALDGDLDGVIDRYNDPDGPRSPWASGPAVDANGNLLVNGDAVDWYDRYARTDPMRANIFNRDTEAIELSGNYDTPVTARQYDALVRLIAWRLDSKMRLPWYVWPKNHDGVQAILWHGEVMGWQKPCPGRVVVDLTGSLIEDVRAYLRKFQEVGGVASGGSTRPEEDPAVLKEWFGRLHTGGRTLVYSPDAAKNPASISAIWRRHGEATGEYPEIRRMRLLEDGTTVYEFEGGYKIIDPAGAAKPYDAGRRGA
jgi:hypothetical protein